MNILEKRARDNNLVGLHVDWRTNQPHVYQLTSNSNWIVGTTDQSNDLVRYMEMGIFEYSSSKEIVDSLNVYFHEEDKFELMEK